MGVETQAYVLENGDTDSIEEDNCEVDAEVNLEAKLISALEEIDKLKEKKAEKVIAKI
jgi:hypothetical protein